MYSASLAHVWADNIVIESTCKISITAGDLKWPVKSYRMLEISRPISWKWNSAIADKPRDTLCNMQWRGWLPLYTRTSPRVTMPNLFYLGQRGNPEIGIHWGHAPFGRGRGWPLNKLPPHVCYHVKFGRSASKGNNHNHIIKTICNAHIVNG